MTDLAAAAAALAAELDFSGTVLVTRGGEQELAVAYGFANRSDEVPNTVDTRYGVASVTKMFTAVAIVDLVARGRLTFDARVVDVLPPERRPSTLRDDVTVAHLLSHTSGIADYYEEEDDEALVDYASLWIDRPLYGMKRPLDFLPLFGDLPPYRAPGLKVHYSNAGYVVLGLVIEELSDAAFIDVVEDRVLARAGMTDSGFFALDEVRPRMAVGYTPPEEPGGRWRTNAYGLPIVGGADGGTYCSAPDLARFLTAYDDGTLLGDLREEVLTPRGELDPGIAIGYGVQLRGEGPTFRFGHGGWDPGVEVLITRIPAQDVNAIVVCNVAGPTGPMRDLVVGHLLGT